VAEIDQHLAAHPPWKSHLPAADYQAYVDALLDRRRQLHHAHEQTREQR
jgi:hypothetical protein